RSGSPAFSPPTSGACRAHRASGNSRQDAHGDSRATNAKQGRNAMRAYMAGCLMLSAGISASAAAAQETIKLHVISAQSPRMLTVGMISNFMLPEVNKRLKERGSNYRIEWRESYSGVVAGNRETFAAIQNRVADMGQVGTLFEAA